jgi:hypothetical protein
MKHLAIFVDLREMRHGRFGVPVLQYAGQLLVVDGNAPHQVANLGLCHAEAVNTQIFSPNTSGFSETFICNCSNENVVMPQLSQFRNFRNSSFIPVGGWLEKK